MKRKLFRNAFVAGTLSLTAAGVLSRCLGFLVRIFLSRTLGEEGMGLYSLSLPVFSVGVSVCGLGLQTALSRTIAAHRQKTPGQSRYLLHAALLLSISLSLVFSGILYSCSPWISAALLGEARCAGLLRMLSLSMPFSCIHACCCGFYYGHEKTKQPAISWLLEELIRGISLVVIWLLRMSQNQNLTLTDAVTGTLLSEIGASLYIWMSRYRVSLPDTGRQISYPAALGELAKTALPLSGNRFVTTVLSGLEHTLIPFFLQHFGLSVSQSLAVFGVFSGMAMPFILFPCTVTNAISVLLLPKIAAAKAAGEKKLLVSYSKNAVLFTIGMGCLFTIFFYLAGPLLGSLCFRSTLAGKYIRLLSLLCPFLYLSAACASILNGLGRPSLVFFHTVICLTLRLAAVIFLIPIGGISGYLLGLLTSQLLLCALHIDGIRRSLLDPSSADLR